MGFDPFPVSEHRKILIQLGHDGQSISESLSKKPRGKWLAVACHFGHIGFPILGACLILFPQRLSINIPVNSSLCFFIFISEHMCYRSRFYVSGDYFLVLEILCSASYLAVLIDSLPGKNDTTHMVVSFHFYLDS